MNPIGTQICQICSVCPRSLSLPPAKLTVYKPPFICHPHHITFCALLSLLGCKCPLFKMCAFAQRAMRIKSSWVSQEMSCLSSLAGLTPRNEELLYQAMYTCGKKGDTTVKLPVWAWRGGRTLHFHALWRTIFNLDEWVGLMVWAGAQAEFAT